MFKQYSKIIESNFSCHCLDDCFNLYRDLINLQTLYSFFSRVKHLVVPYRPPHLIHN